MPQTLASLQVTAQLSGLSGRAIATSRGHHFVTDSPPPLGGPNEELNPLDLLLSALATCGVFVCETKAREMGIGLYTAKVTAEGDFDPRGVRDGSVNPRIQAFRVMLRLGGITPEQAEALGEAFRTRCPIYTTLERAAPIDLHIETS